MLSQSSGPELSGDVVGAAPVCLTGCWSCDVQVPMNLYLSLVINPLNASGKREQYIYHGNIQCTLLNVGCPTMPLLYMKADVYMSQTGSA